MAQRNLAFEKKAVDDYIKKYGKKPETPESWNVVHRIAYPTLNDLPEEMKNEQTLSYYQGTGTSPTASTPAPTINPMAQTPEASGIDALATQKQAASQRVQDLSGGNEALRVLQEAIRTKTGVAQAPIGESKIFEQAGVKGYGALGQSLAARGNEISTNFANFQNVISQMSGTYKDMASTAMFKYQQASDEYNAEVSRLQSILDKQEAYKREIEIMKQQHDNEKELAAIQHQYRTQEARIPSITEQTNLYNQGLTLDSGGNVITDTSGATADQIANAIAQHESGGNFGAKGATGENGAFQFMPGTWNIISQQYAQANGINQSIPMTQENEDKVARWKIGSLVQQGYNAQDIALIWNGSLGGSEKPVVKSGVNSKGVKYDTGAYAKSVMNILQKEIKSGGGGGSSTDKIAQDIFNGTSTMKLADVPTKDRPAVSAALTALKQNALKTNDIDGIIRASAGGSAPSDSFKQSFEKGINVVYQISDLQNSITKEQTGPILGIVRSNNPYDAKAALIKAQLTAIVPNLARGIYGEVGVLTDNDVALYSKTLPTLTSTEDVRKLVLGATVRSVQRSLENKMKIQAGTGTDISGLADVYKEVKAKADSLLGSETSSSSPELQSAKDKYGISY